MVEWVSAVSVTERAREQVKVGIVEMREKLERWEMGLEWWEMGLEWGQR